MSESLGTSVRSANAISGIRQPSRRVVRIGRPEPPSPVFCSAKPPYRPIANRRTNEITSTAFFETPISAFMRLAKMPSAKANTGTLVRLEIAISKESMIHTLQEEKYRYSVSAIIVL